MKPLYKKNFSSIKLLNSQLSLLLILASGATQKEAAAILGVSLNTIKARVKTLYAKFGVNSRVDLIKQAVRRNVINYKDIKPRFRRRFVNLKNETQKPILREPLSDEELVYLRYASIGMRQKDIIKIMNLSGIFHARVLVMIICYKLNAKNILEAIVNANKLENILKPTF